MMKKILLSALLFIFLISWTEEKVKEISVIPQPENVIFQEGNFELNAKTSIYFGNNTQNLAAYFFEALHKAGFSPDVFEKTEDEKNLKNVIELELDSNPTSTAKEGYFLKIEKNRILLRASSPAGLFYATQTFLQLIPTEQYSVENRKAKVALPCLEITDNPRFAYRGMHLDVCRHKFPVEFIKRYIDLLAMYKFNTFHWHLTDDQGWRIEIKKYPRLMEVAAFRDSTIIGRGGNKPRQYDGQRYGGYYTQEEIKEIVQYAADRQIIIIPEIEMPGHSLAALSAYPELACTPGPFQAATTWGVFDDIFCTKEETFTFIEGVLDEVMELFPSTYIHIGGDEAPKTRWKACPVCQANMKKAGLKDEMELQSWFVHRIESYLNEHGRQLIGWDEILEGGLSPKATVMSWRGTEGGIAAAKQGHDAIMTPTSNCYFDYYQANREFQPLAIGGLITLKKVYSYEPFPEVLNIDEAKHILGAQANLWTEYISTTPQAEYMVLPRMAALAEVVWSQPSSKNWPDFQRRINEHFKLYQIQGLNYCPGSYRVEILAVPDSVENNFLISLESEIYQPEIRFTTDGSIPDTTSEIYSKPFIVSSGTTILAAVFLNGKMLEKLSELVDNK